MIKTNKKLIIAVIMLMAILMSITIFLPANNVLASDGGETEPTEPYTPKQIQPQMRDEDENGQPDQDDGYYLISEATHLEWFARERTEGRIPINSNVKLLNNINCGGDILSPIGKGDGTVSYFQGTFDGGGNTISNFIINKQDSTGDLGFFIGLGGDLNNKTIVKNIVLKDVVVENSSTQETAILVSNILANTKIEGIKIEGDHSYAIGKSSVGGIAGYIQITDADIDKKVEIIDCIVEATITSTGTGASLGIGGIVADSDNTVKGHIDIINCKFSGVFSTNETNESNKTIGGIVGQWRGGTNTDLTLTIKNCTNDSNIEFSTKNTTNRAGGIMGMFTLPTGANAACTKTINIIDCVNNGAVISALSDSGNTADSLGGILGYFNTNSSNYPVKMVLNISGCTNNATIGNKDSTTSPNRNTSGILGYCVMYSSNNTVSIDSCINTVNGKVYGSNSVGGIVGTFRNFNQNYSVTKIDVTNCKNYGDITSITHEVGGIVGYIMASSGSATETGITDWNKQFSIINCHNYGNIAGSATDGVGGVLGVYRTGNATYTNTTETAVSFTKYTEKLTISECSNEGDVLSKENNAGGIVGTATGTLSHSGIDITALSNGDVERDVIITKNYNRGDVVVAGRIVAGIIGGFGMGAGTESSNNGGLVNLEVSKNYNSGAITGGTDGFAQMGGIIGFYSSRINGNAVRAKTEVTDNFNTAAFIIGYGQLAGIIASVSFSGTGWKNDKDSLLFARNYSTTTEILGTNKGGFMGNIVADNEDGKLDIITIENSYTVYPTMYGVLANVSKPKIYNSIVGLNLTQMLGSAAFTNMPNLNENNAFVDVENCTPQFAHMTEQNSNFNESDYSFKKSTVYFDYGVYEPSEEEILPNKFVINYGDSIQNLPTPEISPYTLEWQHNNKIYTTGTAYLDPTPITITARFSVEVTYI